MKLYIVNYILYKLYMLCYINVLRGLNWVHQEKNTVSLIMHELLELHLHQS